ncbi:MAG: amidohydrolase family protein [Myxococcota bacterium]|nr:amidohydrolase family protein [Myxococcota bacterium]
MSFDLILKGGAVLDGTGADAEPVSIGVRQGRIAAVGDLDAAEATREIDCSGLTITPGFIDMHSHSDWVLPQPGHGEVLAPLVEQGITTLVGGNCGSSPAPCCGQNEQLLPLMAKLLHDDELDYEWSGMGEFLGALDERGVALNVAQLAGHGAIRSAIKGLDPRPSTPDERAQMADLARACLDQGAIGLSTGLGYAPGIFADVGELVDVTAPLAERGGVYTSHARSYVALAARGQDEETPSNQLALDETAAIHRAHGVPVQHSHLIFVGDATWPSTDRILEHLDALRGEVDIAVDAFPYVGGNTTLIVFLPPWALADMQTALDPGGDRERLLRAVDRTFERVGMRWEDTQILWVPRREHADYEGQTVAEIARERGRSGTETYLDLVAELGGSTRIINWNYSGRDDEETSLRKVLSHPLTCFETDTILTGHGVDNPASFGTFPRVLGRYVRELGLFSLPEAVRRMTSLSAERMGLRDRGRIAEGLAADLVVFDAGEVGDRATRHDPSARSVGIDRVLINGQVVVEGGRFDASSRAGAVLRRDAS